MSPTFLWPDEVAYDDAWETHLEETAKMVLFVGKLGKEG